MFLKRLKFNLNILYVNCMDSWPQHYTSLTELHNSYNAVLWVFLFLKLIGFSLTQRPSNDKMLICTIWLGSNSDYADLKLSFFFFLSQVALAATGYFRCPLPPAKFPSSSWETRKDEIFDLPSKF